MPEERINHPDHYGGDTPYEAIKVIEAWDLGFNLGNAVKYISRAGKKPGEDIYDDLLKARWYLQREIDKLEVEDPVQDVLVTRCSAVGYFPDTGPITCELDSRHQGWHESHPASNPAVLKRWAS